MTKLKGENTMPIQRRTNRVSRVARARQKATTATKVANYQNQISEAANSKSITKANNRIAKIEKANEVKAAKNQARILKAEGRRQGNWFERRFQEKADIKAKQKEVKMRELESKARSAELDPQIKELEAKTKAQTTIAKAKAAGKIGGYTAIGGAVSNLGRGLIDEQNRDDKKAENALRQNLELIFGNGNDSSNNNNNQTTTSADLTEGVE